MASITVSVIVSDVKQIDGRRWIREQHTDNAGIVRVFQYLAQAADDAASFLTTHASQLATALSNIEIEANVSQVINLGSLATPSLIYSTASNNIAALRAAYATATDRQAVMIGDYLNTLTDAQLMTAFSLTQSQVTTLRTNKLQPAATLASQIRASAGQ